MKVTGMTQSNEEPHKATREFIESKRNQSIEEVISDQQGKPADSQRADSRENKLTIRDSNANLLTEINIDD